jgi:hypothetical protein
MSFDDRLLNGVSALAAVVRSGGFAAAARSLNVSQPGISRAVARLEAQVGIRLLERTTRSVTLTDEGRRFYEMPARRGAGTGIVFVDARSFAHDGQYGNDGELRRELWVAL